MRLIYLTAYCCQNLGDDMFLDMILNRYPQCKFYIFASSKNMKGLKKHNNLILPSAIEQFVIRSLRKLKIISSSSENEILRKKADASVWIGGSIFIESSGWEERIHKSWYSYNNIFYISSNFGPVITDYYKSEAAKRIKVARDCCFRDLYSKYLFDSFDNVRYAPDALFGYSYPSYNKDGHGVAISVIELARRKKLTTYHDTYISVISELCDTCIEKNIPVTLLGFCEQEEDGKAISQIIDRVKYPQKVDRVLYNGDIQAVIEKINEHEYVVASRFHAMIIGWCLNKKVFPILYSDKQDHVISDLCFEGKSWHLNKGEEMDASTLFNDMISNPIIDITDVKKKANNQFKALDDFLRG